MPRESQGPRLIQRRNRPNYFIRYIDPKSGQQRDESTGTGNRNEATKKLAEFLLQWSEPREKRMRVNGMVLAEVLARYAILKEKAGNAERLKHSMKRLIPFWGHLKTDDIDEESILDYRLANPARSSGTLRRELTDLRSAVNYAARKEFIRPISFPELPPDSPAKQRWLTESEFANLLWHSRKVSRSKHNLPTFLMIAFYTGARKGAIMDLEWNQVNFVKGEIDFLKEGGTQTTKKKARTPMAAQLQRHLRRRFRQFGSRSAYLFHRNYEPFAPVKSVDTGFEKAAEISGLDDVTPHTLRHTRASLMIQNGMPMKVVSEILDMSIETLNKIYAHIAQDQLNEMAPWMGRAATMRTQNVRTSDKKSPKKMTKSTKSEGGKRSKTK